MEMKQQTIRTEGDIFSVIRELEACQAGDLKKSTNEGSAELPNPMLLKESLEKKLKLINLLDGYSEAKQITEKKEELVQALGYLDELITELPEEPGDLVERKI